MAQQLAASVTFISPPAAAAAADSAAVAIYVPSDTLEVSSTYNSTEVSVSAHNSTDVSVSNVKPVYETELASQGAAQQRAATAAAGT